jgi:hypothetical protein
MKSFAKPTDEVVGRSLALMTDPEHRRYFLDRLNNPEWVRPLRDRGFFRTPPEPVRNEAEGTIAFPFWAESRYLARMAADAGEEVLATIEAMPATENVRVYEDGIDAALAMPGPLAARMVPLALEWLKVPYRLLLPEKLGLLMGRLTREGEVEAAFVLASALLDVAPSPLEGRWPDGTAFGGEARPLTGVDGWEYERAIKERLPALAALDAPRVVALLCDKLEAALRIEERQEASSTSEDFSFVWRQSIGDHGGSGAGRLKDYLVEGVRDAILSISGGPRGSLPRVLDELESRRLKIFRRIALYVLCETPTADRERTEARLRDRQLFDDIGVWHEYYCLLERCFGGLPAEGQREILGWLDEEGRPAEGDSDDDAQGRRYSQLMKLTPIVDYLPEDWRRRHRALVEEFGEIEHPSFHVWTGSTITGTTSPRSTEELVRLSDTDLVAFLQTWRPAGGALRPSLRGLAEALREAVVADADRFAMLMTRMEEGVDPTYVSSLLHGLTTACREHKRFGWREPLALATHVAQRPREHQPLLADAWEANQDWGCARLEAARLLSQGLHEGATEVPFEFREEIWNAIRPLTDDPDPTPEHESEYGGDNAPPYDLAINSVRGTAMEAVALYALWCLRHLRPEAKEGTGPPVLDGIPEVREVLERHLDPALDSSAAVRSLYGRFLPWLVLLSAPWVAGHLPQLFPSDPDLGHLRDAAWDTYVIFCQPFDSVFEVVEGEYAAAVARLSREERGSRGHANPGQSLGEHLFAFYARGKTGLDCDGSLVQGFFRHAAAKVRAGAVGSLGLQLLRTSGEALSPQVRERLRQLWESRVGHAAELPKGADQTELLAFFAWFASGAFEASWSLATLQAMLQITEGRSDHGKQVLERLSVLAPDYPWETVTAAAAMVKKDAQSISISWWSDELRAVLAASMASPDEQTRSMASDLIHWMGSRGFHQFRDLLGQRGAA